MKRLLSLFLILCALGALVPQAGAVFQPAGALLVDGKPQSVSAFAADDSHYFRLRDVAAALAETDKSFDVAWDAAQKLVSILPGCPYDPSGGEDAALPPDFSAAVPATAAVLLDGARHDLAAYLVQGHYYIKLRDVLRLLDCGVFWDGRRSQIQVDTAYPYVEADHRFSPLGNVLILMYHDFTTADAPPPGKGAVVTTAAKFEADIRALLDAGCKPLCLEDLYLNRIQAEERYFVLTCDDGYLSNYQVAFPILEELQVPMDIFINTDNTGLSHHFTLEQGREMEESGLVRVYSHFPQHVSLPSLDPADLSVELRRSVETLETVLAPKHFYFFAYPYGDFNEATFQAVSAAGFVFQLAQRPLPGARDVLVRVNMAFESDVLDLAARAYWN